MEMLTYTEANAEAKKIHPDAEATLNEAQEWVYFIKTEKTDSYNLGKEFEGTPAWEAYETVEYGENKLEIWADSFGYRGCALEIKALGYNLFTKKAAFARGIVVSRLEEAGLPEWGDEQYSFNPELLIRANKLVEGVEVLANEEFMQEATEFMELVNKTFLY